MIVVFGSSVMDVLMAMPRLPLAGETVLANGYEIRPGGKGANQAVAAVRAGGLVNFFGAVGDDSFGRELLRSLEEEGLEPDGVTVVSEPSAAAVVLVGPDGGNQIAIAPGANLAASADLVPDGLLGPDALVVLQMETRPEENWRLLERARALGARTLLNLAPAQPVPRHMLPLVDILVVNEVEAAALAAQTEVRESDPAAIAAALRQISGGAVIITLGPAGSIAALPEGIARVPALAVDVVDTTGAGDTYVGALSAALDGGFSWSDALYRASVAGSLACRGFGARSSMPDVIEVADGLQRLAAGGHA